LIPEFVGRFPVICTLGMLTEDELARVLTEPRSALLKQYAAIFNRSDAKFHVSEAGARAIAGEAATRGVGARGLRSILEKLLLDAAYHAPEPDVEGVILHVAEDGSPQAHLCHGKGSFKRTLTRLGEPMTVVEPAVPEEPLVHRAKPAPELPQAATV